MNERYRVFRRAWGMYYCQDVQTGKQESLKTRDKHQAFRLVAAKNETADAPAFSMHLARVYWRAGDPQAATRTWGQIMDEIPKLHRGNTRVRWETAINNKGLDPLRDLVVLETRPEDFLRVLEAATVSTNSYLRRIHSFAMDMNWLPWPVLPRKRWPVIRFKDKRAITWPEHQKILAGESNPEWRAYYELLWNLGGSQTDVARLTAESIDWEDRSIAYSRVKTGSQDVIRFDDVVEQILKSRPSSGYLFPMIASWKHSDRAKAFIRRCKLVEVSGISLHSYRYSWAERAKKVGYPDATLMTPRETAMTEPQPM
jgi:integrase